MRSTLRVIWTTAAALAVTACLTGAGKRPPRPAGERPLLTALALNGDAGDVDAVQVIDGAAEPLLSRGAPAEPALFSLNDGQARPLFAFDVMATSAVWDATGVGGAAWVVYQKPGSALSALALRRSDAEGPTALTKAHADGFFSRPRFASAPGGAAPAILSVALVDDRPALVVFPPQREGGYGPFVGIDTGGDEVEDARLLTVGDGRLLLYKRRSPLGPPGVRTGGDGHPIIPGPIMARPLTRDLRPAGPAVQVLDEPVYEFDATLVGGRPTVFATTAAGFALLHGEDGRWRTETSRTAPLASPSVADAGGRPRLAAIANARSRDAAVMVSPR